MKLPIHNININIMIDDIKNYVTKMFTIFRISKLIILTKFNGMYFSFITYVIHTN